MTIVKSLLFESHTGLVKRSNCTLINNQDAEEHSGSPRGAQLPQHWPLAGWAGSARSTPLPLAEFAPGFCGSFFGNFLAEG